MAQAQKGIYAEPSLHGITLQLNVMTDDVISIRRKLARIPAMLDELDERFSEALLTGYVAIGSDYWDILYPQQRPPQFGNFPDLRDGDRQAPREPVDLLITIRSDRFDVNYFSARAILEWLGHDVELTEQTPTFRFMDGRDLTGFIDAPENPRGIRRRQLALIHADDDPVFAGGSYLFVQKFRHDLRRWEQLDQAAQEQIIGRKKLNGERISEAQLSGVSHTQKARLQNEQEQSLHMLRQNMPWGDMREQGLMGMYFTGQPRDVIQWLKQRYIADQNGDYDPLLDYIEAVTNACYFVPSLDFLTGEI
ncbi:peroxidase [Pseudidiomarina atlantica]|uniref:Peroxidase n=1 Tax=Pseudidiomarina atlantica TaxID=1517416 RepID=A0A094J901_9GAMM|nr:Dyp-type peroxidase [Pseudidiomarina atlantica]KFZ29081.1 peroxidase [Pseudidiomarina atlantica]